MAHDHYPPTRGTWIQANLAEGTLGRREVNHHIMQVYARPLEIYFRAMPDSRFVEPEEAVSGFFEDRLSRPGFFEEWQRSDLRLRRWLMNAFRYYVLEQRKRRRRSQAVAPLPEQAPGSSADPARAAEGEFARSILHEAVRRAQEACRDAGYGSYWDLFIRHEVDKQPYCDLVEEFHVTERRAATMVRTARDRLREAVRDLLRQDGVPESELDHEIGLLKRWIDD